MPKYNSGEEVRVGDTIGVLFTVTNVVSDSERLNVIARTEQRHHGQIDDQRYQFSSERVELVRAAPKPEPELVADPQPAVAQEATDSQTAQV
jgi:rubrerythrin